jgi:hypothetical protein
MRILDLPLLSVTTDGGMRPLLLLLLLLAIILIVAGGVIALLTWSRQRKEYRNFSNSERR